MNIKVKKFSWNPESKEVCSTYTVEVNKQQEKHTLECSDKPKAELLDAMQALDEMALAECEVIRVADKKERAA
jgi:hypothetical protein